MVTGDRSVSPSTKLDCYGARDFVKMGEVSFDALRRRYAAFHTPFPVPRVESGVSGRAHAAFGTTSGFWHNRRDTRHPAHVLSRIRLITYNGIYRLEEGRGAACSVHTAVPSSPRKARSSALSAALLLPRPIRKRWSNLAHPCRRRSQLLHRHRNPRPAPPQSLRRSQPLPLLPYPRKSPHLPQAKRPYKATTRLHRGPSSTASSLPSLPQLSWPSS